jgi:hypothetical protein
MDPGKSKTGGGVTMERLQVWAVMETVMETGESGPES